ncbi:hypothetical protein [Bradyrhizobium sp. HKCCYLR20261]|uniref:hypothetical protein n=1 Tax=Bradyrhizobium sp. HKCCYLR20261 TaxID=3420760 RepID=UPI003EB9141B
MLTFQSSLTFTKGVQPEEGLRNFWGPEDGFVWSSGKWCELSFAFDAKGVAANALCDLILDLDVYKHGEELKGQNLMFYFNGLRIGSLYCTKRSTVVFSFDAGLLKAEENVLTIDSPEAASPSQFGSQDSRTLGVQLFSLQIRPIE